MKMLFQKCLPALFVVFIFFLHSCTKDEQPNETGTVTDAEGNVYGTVKIGNQWWMSENLNIGVMISGNVAAENNGDIEKYCYNDLEENCNHYGGLYSWDELMAYSTQEGAQGICPDGWHVPTDEEVKQLEMALGMSRKNADLANAWRGTNEGGKLREGGSSGFNMLFSGGKRSDSLFFNQGDNAYFYTSTEASSGAWRRCLQKSNKKTGRFNSYPKTYALSVRCIKD
jgi:uncharacterized protein (TIGR02145 family)